MGHIFPVGTAITKPTLECNAAYRVIYEPNDRWIAPLIPVSSFPKPAAYRVRHFSSAICPSARKRYVNLCCIFCELRICTIQPNHILLPMAFWPDTSYGAWQGTFTCYRWHFHYHNNNSDTNCMAENVRQRGSCFTHRNRSVAPNFRLSVIILALYQSRAQSIASIYSPFRKMSSSQNSGTSQVLSGTHEISMDETLLSSFHTVTEPDIPDGGPEARCTVLET